MNAVGKILKSEKRGKFFCQRQKECFHSFRLSERVCVQQNRAETESSRKERSCRVEKSERKCSIDLVVAETKGVYSVTAVAHASLCHPVSS